MELAEMVSQTTISIKVGRRSLIETIKGSLSVNEIGIKIPQVKERVRENRKKDNMLSKLNRAQLKELTRQASDNSRFSAPAEMAPGDPLENGISRSALVKAIKESMSWEEISRRIHVISERILEEERKNRIRILWEEKKNSIRLLDEERKDSILRKLNRIQLKELAQPLPPASNGSRTSSTALIRMISSSSTLEYIKGRTAEIRNRETKIKRANQLRALRTNKAFVIFLLSIIIYSSFAVGSSLAYNNWRPTSIASPPTEEWSRTLGTNRFYEFSSIQQTRDGGFIMTGTSGFLNQPSNGILLVRTDSAGNIQWNKTIKEYQFSPIIIQETSDGGYIILGSRTYQIRPTGWDSVVPIQWNSQIYLVKTDSVGEVQWNRTYTNQEIGFASEIAQTSDLGYIVGGSAYQDPSAACLVKMDSGGVIQWEATYVFSGYLYDISSILQTSDNEYVIGGTVWSNSSQYDFMLAKIDQNGMMEWNKTYGGAGDDVGRATLITNDGGFAMLGITTQIGSGIREAWLMKMDLLGNLEWNKTYSVNSGDPQTTFPVESVSLLKTSDDGYVIAGSSHWSFWLMKTDSNGTAKWSMTYAALTYNRVYSVFPAFDGGYVIAGEQGFPSEHGGVWSSFTLLQTNSIGIIEWSRKFGGCCHYFDPMIDYPPPEYIHRLSASAIGLVYPQVPGTTCVLDTSDGGYIAVGTVCELGTSGTGLSLTKLNSSGAVQWNRIYDGKYFDFAVSVLQASDGGYVVAGSTCSWGFFDYWLIKTDSEGATQWNRVYGDVGDAYLSCVVATSDGGYIMVGSENQAHGTWVLKVDAAGYQKWSRHIYSSNGGSLSSIVETSDGGCIMTGYTVDILSQEYYWLYVSYVWLVEIDLDGTVQLDKVVEGTQGLCGWCISGTSDSGYIIAAYGSDYSLDYGVPHILLVKIGSNGISEWNRTYELGDIMSISFLHQTSDGGYIIGASLMQIYIIIRYSTVGQLDSLPVEDKAFLLIKTNSSGQMQWNTTLGHAGYDFGFSAHQTSDGGYIVAWHGATSVTDDYGLMITKSSGSPLPIKTPLVFFAISGGATVLFVCFAILLCKREEMKKSGGAS